MLTEAYGKDFPNFKLEAFEQTEIAGRPATSMRARYGLPSKAKREGTDAKGEATLLPVVMHQFIVAGPDRYLVVTCTFAEERAGLVAPICRESVESIAFDAPAAAAGPKAGATSAEATGPVKARTERSPASPPQEARPAPAGSGATGSD